MKKFVLSTLLMLVCAIGFAQEEQTWTDSEGNVWKFEITDNENHYVTLRGLESGENATVPGVVKVGDVDYYVRAIGDWAFKNNQNIKAISDLPKCASIGTQAFDWCSCLTSIGDLPICTSIGNNAFGVCGSLSSVGNLPECTSIGEYAFARCEKLLSIGDLSKCTSIGENAFMGCVNLLSVGNLPACTSIGGYAFELCENLLSIGDMPKCTSIGTHAFSCCYSLSSIGDISACTRITEGAFFRCHSLSSIGDLPEITSIDNDAFSECYKLTSIGDLPKCTSIGRDVFFRCVSLYNIGELPVCTSIGNEAFSECFKLYSIGDLPECTSIGSRAFAACGSLSSIGNLPKCTSIGEDALSSCNYLHTITITTDAVPTIQANSLPAATTILVKGSMFEAFKEAEVWKTITTRIVSLDAQREYDITVVPPAEGSGVYDIIGEENLKNVLSLKLSGEINSYDFFIMRNNMPNLHAIDMSNARIVASDYKYYDNYNTQNDVFPVEAFRGKSNIDVIKLPNSITEIGNAALADIPILEIEIPNSVKTIGSSCFSGCGKLRRVVLPEGLKSLDDDTFNGCGDLESIKFPSSLEEIGSGCFAYNGSIKSVVLPPSLTRIAGAAFAGSGITTVYATALSPKTIQMAADAFSNYQNITLYLPIDEENGWDATYYAYYWDTDWGQFGKREKWTPMYTDVTINADYEQDKGTIPSENDVNIDGQIGTNGGYIVGENASQDLGNVTVEQDDEKGGSIIGEGNDNLSIEKLKCNIKITPNKWYFFCFPFDVDWTELDYADASYIWHKYDGLERAQGNGGWKKLQGNVEDKILQAGEGYIFQANHPFTLTIQCANPDMAAVNKAKELTTYVSSNPENASWNLIGNPFLSYYNMDEMGNSGNDAQYSAPVTVYDGNNYQALRPGDDDYQFHPFQAFFVQKPAGETALTFGSEGRETYTQSVEVQANAKLRRAMARKSSDRQIINLTISDGENADKTRVVFNEAKSMSYEAECDASKFFTTEAVPQIYSVCNGVSYSINERPGAEGCVDLGVRISKDGVYTIEAARMDTPMLLIDHETGTTTDMSEGAYCFTANAGTYADRFSMVKTENVTAIASIKADADNSSVYDLGGRKVTMPQRGVVIKANKKVLMK